jgi:hypothetical protein
MAQRNRGESKKIKNVAKSDKEVSTKRRLKISETERSNNKKKLSHTKKSKNDKKQHNREIERTEKRIKIVVIIIVIFIILALSTGAVYYFLNIGDDNNNIDIEVDSDGDGLFDSWEIDHGLDPVNPDTDGDGMDDGWEVEFALKPLIDDSAVDQDLDGYDKSGNGELEFTEFYTNLQEYELDTDPRNPDTDNDGLPDGWEYYFKVFCENAINNKSRTWLSETPEIPDPKNPDDYNIDIDFLYKKKDVKAYTLSPDGLDNIQEYTKGTDPTKPDTDFDGLSDYDEVEKYGTSPLEVDSDGDKLWDGWEVSFGGLLVGLDPNKYDTDDDGVNDTIEDFDNDNLWNLDESGLGTSPLSNDTDGDSLPDNWEESYWNGHTTDHPHPTIHDSEIDFDNDGLINSLEFIYNTDPKKPDTDQDGLLDGLEVVIGFPGYLVNGSYLTNLEVPRYYTNPLKFDTDDDNINDSEEVNKGEDGYFTNATNPDSDGDGLNDTEEVSYGSDGYITNPNEVDTDNDLLTDFQEIFGTFGYITHPTKPDHDNDGLLDGEEVLTDFHPFSDFDTTVFNCTDLGPIDGTNPLIPDTDDDGMSDGWEAKLGFADRFDDIEPIETFDNLYGFNRLGINYSDLLQNNPDVEGVWLVNPLDNRDKFDDVDKDGFDQDGNGINMSEEFPNISEFQWKTNPFLSDSDIDFMDDGWEVYYYDYSTILSIWGPDPTINDGNIDLDNDGIKYWINNREYKDSYTNVEEYRAGTDPNNDDENNNGKPDYYDFWFDDNDGDGLLNGFEIIFNGKVTDPRGYIPDKPIPWGFDPNKKDTDGDGTNDDQEDYDGDGDNNWREQYIYGDVNLHRISSKPGCSDPTNDSITPETVVKQTGRASFRSMSRSLSGSQNNYDKSTKIKEIYDLLKGYECLLNQYKSNNFMWSILQYFYLPCVLALYFPVNNLHY